MIKTAIIYNHRKRLNKDGTGPVEIRVTIDRRPYYINTGVCVRPREWKFGQVVDVYNANTLNDRLKDMLAKVDEIVTESLKDGNCLDVVEVRRRVFAPDNRKRLTDAEDMVAWMEQEIVRLGVAKGTLAHYRVSVAALAESGTMRKWSDLTVENIHRWDAFLHGIKKHQTDAERRAGMRAQYIGQATVRNYHKDIKALLGRALKFGIIQANPYDKMRGEIKRGDRETVDFLMDDEREAIEGLTLRDGTMLCAARDMFVFQCYTGMAYSDMQAFRLDDCQRDGDKWVLSAQRVKTGVTYYVQLLPQALAVAEKYGGRLPKVAVQVYNRNLKLIAEMIQTRKRVTSHVARHTFATWALRNGVPIEVVSKMLGHSDIKMTQRYAKLVAADIYKQFDRLGALAGKPQGAGAGMVAMT